jgi:putative restriction endonuclease
MLNKMIDLIQLKSFKDLFQLKQDSKISKRNLWDLIQYSKVVESEYFCGTENAIGNTPQQGINWVGNAPNHQLVIIKTKEGKYFHDGYENNQCFNYSFKSQKGIINENETANKCIIHQKKHHYPILLLKEDGKNWNVEGYFNVSDIFDEYVRMLKII